MRKKILELAKRNSDYFIQEAVLTQEILLQADEVFLTNAITGIRWVKECRNKIYKNTFSSKIFTALDQTIQSNLGFTKLFSLDPKR